MIHHKGAVMMAVAGLLASAGFAMAEGTQVQAPTLTLDPVAAAPAAPAAAPAEAAAPEGLLMQGLGKLGLDKPLNDYGINIYGWVESGYTYNHRHDRSNLGGLILPGPFNHEYGNHYMLNQVDVRIERQVNPTKWDVGGMIESLYGTDSNAIHANGLEIGNGGSDDRFNPQYQWDPTQFYVDVGVPVGNGLTVRVGKFVTLLSNETIDPRGNAFYSHSWLFSMVPFTQTGILGIYKVNDNWSVKAGISRGWDQSFEDNNNCAIDSIGQIAYTQGPLTALLNWSVGPEDSNDTSHYRTAIDPIVSYKVTDQLTVTGEALYVYDGGYNGDAAIGESHHYGDTWGLALYGSYKFNDMVTANVRVEKAHFDTFAPLAGYYRGISSSSGSGLPSGLDLSGMGVDTGSLASGASGLNGATNFYAITLGVTVTPFPKDPIGQNLIIRPEIRYDYCEDHVFGNGSGRLYQDQLTFAADVIVKF